MLRTLDKARRVGVKNRKSNQIYGRNDKIYAELCTEKDVGGGGR